MTAQLGGGSGEAGSAQGADLARVATVTELIAEQAPSEPVNCYWPDCIRQQAAIYVDGFLGRVLYAVKCNPDRNVLTWLYEGGVRHFDTASAPEIELVHDLFPDATCYFNHPVKSRQALRIAHDLHGVRDFVVDHDREFDKLLETLGSEILVQVRLHIDNPDAAYAFTPRFGADAATAAQLLKRIQATGANTAISFHVGSQCRRPGAYLDAMLAAGAVMNEAGVPVRYLNVGGGFPADYGDGLAQPGAYFDAIREGYRQMELSTPLPLYAEPGRALVAGGMAVLAQVHLRKDDSLVLNDGIYGSLSELRDMPRVPSTIAYGRNRVLRGEPVPFSIYGPTCDPVDVVPLPFVLPDDIDEGDWVLIEGMGAYSTALVSDFNGFGSRRGVIIEQMPGGDFS